MMANQIRVAMIIQGYYPLVGGAERIVAALAPELQALDVDLHIITRRYKGLLPYEVVHGVPVHRLPIPGPKAVASIMFTVTALMLLQELRPQILHAHEVFSPATTAIAAKWFLGVPAVVTAHRSGSIGDVQRLKQKLFGARRLKVFQRRVDKFIVISREIGTELRGVGVPAEKQAFIPNGVDTRHFVMLAIEAKQQARISMGLPPDASIAIFTGRLAKEKRVGHLINIWQNVRMQYPDAILLILGTGPEEENLKQLAGSGVVFVGRTDDVAPYLQVADVFVLPSVAEGLSVAMLEAMSTGLPVIVTQVGGAVDIISPQVNGWLIQPDDVSMLQTAILTLFQSAELRNRLGQAARADVERDYSLPVIARQLRRVYDDLLRT